jgi:hypothetical protein
MKRSTVLAAVLGLFAAAPAFADDSITFVGKITTVNLDRPTKQFGVKSTDGSSSATYTFYIDDDFQGVFSNSTGEKMQLSDLKPDTLVQVTYRKAQLFGSFRALRVTIMNGFAIPMAQPTGTM